MFLAALWGPAILAVGLGIFLSRSYYVKLYRDLQNEMLAVVSFGVIAIIAGTMQIMVHNIWDSFAQGIVSFLGWALLVKGVIFTMMPKLVDRTGDWEANTGLIPFVGAAMVAIGAYLSWIGYFA